VSRVRPLKIPRLGGLEVAEGEHLCILSDGKVRVGKERLVGSRDKCLAALMVSFRGPLMQHRVGSARRAEAGPGVCNLSPSQGEGR
jgi:hypothetical protein